MANEIRTTIRFEGNEAVSNKLNELSKRLNKREGYGYRFGELFISNDPNSIDYDLISLNSWSYDNTSCKWCFIEEISENEVILVSASHYPELAVKYFIDTLYLVDVNLITSVMYFDEIPLEAGVLIFDGEDVFEESHLSQTDIIDEVIMACEEIEDKENVYDFHCEEWIDFDAEEIYNENVWEILSETFEDFLFEQKSELLNERTQN